MIWHAEGSVRSGHSSSAYGLQTGQWMSTHVLAMRAMYSLSRPMNQLKLQSRLRISAIFEGEASKALI
jgi:hypothetical protein